MPLHAPSWRPPSSTWSRSWSSLLAEGEHWLPELVVDARDHRYSWDAIATRLATTISAARHRYAAYTIWRRQHPATPSRSH
jgi:hypothetical protein